MAATDIVFGETHDFVVEIDAISVSAPTTIIYEDNTGVNIITAITTTTTTSQGESISIF